MAKEKFLIVAVKMDDDCFATFSETENRSAISSGTMVESEAYTWIEGSFEIQLRRYREATHICSFTPSAYYIWLQNAFAGEPNAAWQEDGDPEGLERESGGECHGYGTYHDDYDSRFICDTFTVDTMKDLDDPMRAPSRNSPAEYVEAYHNAIWTHAEEAANEILNNGGAYAPILDVLTYRQWEKECSDKVKERSLKESKRAFSEWQAALTA